jgi:S1-C subfamily serine protease
MRTRVRTKSGASPRFAAWGGSALSAALALLIGVTLAGGLAGCSIGTTTSSSQGAQTTTATTTIGTATATTTTVVGHPDVLADLESPAQEVLNAVYSSVVNIAVTATQGGRSTTGVGSGIVYTSDGYIMTNDHVVTLDGAVSSGQKIVVTLSSGEQLDATIVGEDAGRDLAVVKVEKTGLNPVTFAKSSDVKLAEWAVVIGSPLDFRNTITLGIVSGLDRTLDDGSGAPPLTGLMQVDAAISPGNSGGGCFDAQGHFIGMPEVYLPPGQTGAENIGFAIPADTVAQVAKTLTGR